MTSQTQESDRVQGISLQPAIPILRMFDLPRARAFYLDFLGFAVDWEHRNDVDFPLYMQISREGCVLHLSEHLGDATPGSGCFVPIQGVAGFCAELLANDNANQRPILETMPWGKQFKLTDPFGNKLTFCEQISSME